MLLNIFQAVAIFETAPAVDDSQYIDVLVYCKVFHGNLTNTSRYSKSFFYSIQY